MSFLNILQAGLEVLASQGGTTARRASSSGLGDAIGSLLGGGNKGNALGSILGAAGGGSNSALGGLGGLLGAGALGSLLGSGGSTSKKITLLGAGALAYTLYQKWKNSQQQNAYANTQNASVQSAWTQNASSNTIDAESALVVRAMVYASKADGNIDANEHECMSNIIAKILPNVNTNALISQISGEPLDPRFLASAISNNEQAVDIYRLSCMVIDIDHFMERGYLDTLASELGIDKNSAHAIEQEAQMTKQELSRQFF